MPLTPFQQQVLSLLAPNRSPESYVAGGTALHFKPNSTRFSRDVDIFHDSVELVARSFALDEKMLSEDGFEVDVQISQPGFIRAVVHRGTESTLIDWARESLWRFIPVQKVDPGGYSLHEIDLAINKILTLAGRDEPRDFVDVLYILDHILPLGPLVWAAVEKDPGFSPMSLLEMLKRRGRIRPEELDRLDLAAPLDLERTRVRWSQELDNAEKFVLSRPPDETGCLYWSSTIKRFVEPDPGIPLADQHIVPHHGRPGGILPSVSDSVLRDL